MTVLACINEALKTKKRFRLVRMDEEGPGPWMKVITNPYLWISYDECSTMVKDYGWIRTSELLGEWEMEK